MNSVNIDCERVKLVASLIEWQEMKHQWKQIIFILSTVFFSISYILSFWKEDEENLLVGIETWNHGILLGKWRDDLKTVHHNYHEEWKKLLTLFNLPVHGKCNMVDIGAHDGDTALNLAEASDGGTVVAFEMGPPVHLLNINKKLNPHLDIEVHNVAVSNSFGLVNYSANCKEDCNGGQGKISMDGGEYQVESVRLYPFLSEHYSSSFIKNICMVKIDTEGHDVIILEDLKNFSWRPHIMWVEWFIDYKWVYSSKYKTKFIEDFDLCTPESAKLFQTIIDLGYEIFEPSLPFKKVVGCQNINFQQDLLLIEQNFFKEWSKQNEIYIPNIEKPYEIVVFNTSEDYEIGGLSHVPDKLMGFLI